MDFCIRVEAVAQVSNEQYLAFETEYRELYASEIGDGSRSPIMSKDDMLQFWKETRSDAGREDLGDLVLVWDFSDVVSLEHDR